MIDPAKIFANLPAGLRTPLMTSYQEISANFAEHRWEPAELNGGKLAEVVYTIIDGHIKGAYAAKPSKPRDMKDACLALEKIPSDPKRVGDRSLRILIPRVLLSLYEIRNNRGVGHAGGDVDPNYLDATAVYGLASWVVAELVRIFHNIPTHEAQAVVDTLVERKLPLIWDTGGIKRVLDPKMPKVDQVLLLLYQTQGWAAEEDLFVSVEYSKLSMFRTRILQPLHKARLAEYDEKQKRIKLSPTGAADVEKRLIRV